MARNPEILLVEPTNLFPQDTARRPNGSLGPVSLGGSLLEAGYDAKYLDMSVGTNEHTLEDVFLKDRAPNEKGLVHVGMTDDEIREAVTRYDIVLLTNIFTPQTNSALNAGRLIKEVNPETVLLAGGINAWSLPDRFLDAGFDGIGLGEGEATAVHVADAISRGEDWRNTPGLIVRENGETRNTGIPHIVIDLDQLPQPAFHLWPLNKYWKAASPHGGDYTSDQELRYASVLTSVGCPYECSYCHISSLKEDSTVGPIGNLRLKSLDRVVAELETLKGLGAKLICFEDDSLLAKPRRAMEIFQAIKGMDLRLAGLNGVNIVHMFTREKGRLVVNRPLLESMAEAGFEQMVLPFESGSQRVIDKYASGKWNLEKHNVVDLIKVCNELGIRVPGNFMIGFPDETQAELQTTLDLAKRLKQEGLGYASFFIVVPYPGSALFNEAMVKGWISKDFDPDIFHWGMPVMSGTSIPADQLVDLRKRMWMEVNDPEYVKGKLKRNVVPERTI